MIYETLDRKLKTYWKQGMNYAPEELSSSCLWQPSLKCLPTNIFLLEMSSSDLYVLKDRDMINVFY